MDQLTLSRIVRHEGRCIRGFRSTLVLEPIHNDGWVWNVDGKDIPITPDIMVSKKRRIALVYGKHMLNEFEHIGILRAAGMQHVRISCTQAWPPYDGGSFALWQAVIPYVYKAGVLHPHRLPNGISALEDDPTRCVTYYGDGNDRDVLRMTGLVEFPSIREGIYRFGHVYPTDDLLELVRARTLGWPPLLRYPLALASKIGWPHYDRILWPQEHYPAETLEETGRHRLQDALAILNFAAPTGRYLAGAFHTGKGNHATDLGLLKKLSANKIVGFKKAA